MTQEETLYELLQDFKSPYFSVSKGVTKTEKQWMDRFALLNPGDCRVKRDWFKRVEKKTIEELLEVIKKKDDEITRLSIELGRLIDTGVYNILNCINCSRFTPNNSVCAICVRNNLFVPKK